MTEYNKVFDLRNDWERWTDRKIQLNTVKKKVETMLKANEYSLEDRRERYGYQLLILIGLLLSLDGRPGDYKTHSVRVFVCYGVCVTLL